jgi:hypothetical protein
MGAGVARIRVFGTEMYADVVRDNGDGTYLMMARSHSARTVAGTQITVKKTEIIEMAAAEQPPTADGQAALEAAMAAERKTLPSPAEIMATNREAAAKSAATVSTNPPQRP